MIFHSRSCHQVLETPLPNPREVLGDGHDVPLDHIHYGLDLNRLPWLLVFNSDLRIEHSQVNSHRGVCKVEIDLWLQEILYAQPQVWKMIRPEEEALSSRVSCGFLQDDFLFHSVLLLCCFSHNCQRIYATCLKVQRMYLDIWWPTYANVFGLVLCKHTKFCKYTRLRSIT